MVRSKTAREITWQHLQQLYFGFRRLHSPANDRGYADGNRDHTKPNEGVPCSNALERGWWKHVPCHDEDPCLHLHVLHYAFRMPLLADELLHWRLSSHWAQTYLLRSIQHHHDRLLLILYGVPNLVHQHPRDLLPGRFTVQRCIALFYDPLHGHKLGLHHIRWCAKLYLYLEHDDEWQQYDRFVHLSSKFWRMHLLHVLQLDLPREIFKERSVKKRCRRNGCMKKTLITAF